MVPEFELATGCQFEILQVKEKFGGLRFYVNGANDTIRRSLEAAVQESLHTCEIWTGKTAGKRLDLHEASFASVESCGVRDQELQKWENTIMPPTLRKLIRATHALQN